MASDLNSSAGAAIRETRVVSLDEQVGLGQVLARSAQGFPDKSHCIQAQDFHARVSQEKHFIRHVVEHFRVSIVKVPLVAVESCPDPLADFCGNT